jgi:hypothetical protein
MPVNPPDQEEPEDTVTVKSYQWLDAKADVQLLAVGVEVLHDGEDRTPWSRAGRNAGALSEPAQREAGLLAAGQLSAAGPGAPDMRSAGRSLVR